jgi:hypothetical protein
MVFLSAQFTFSLNPKLGLLLGILKFVFFLEFQTYQDLIIHKFTREAGTLSGYTCISCQSQRLQPGRRWSLPYKGGSAQAGFTPERRLRKPREMREKKAGEYLQAKPTLGCNLKATKLSCWVSQRKSKQKGFPEQM